MTNKLQQIVNSQEQQQCAMRAGVAVHQRLGRVCFYPDGSATGNADIVSKLRLNPELVEIMGILSKPEVPIAGFVKGKFISRRIDRLYVNTDTKTVIILDYKTDKDKEQYYTKYTEQLKEYREILKMIYRHFCIQCKILWINDFTLENIE